MFWSSRAECVEVVWTHGENGGGPVGEENCRRCEVESKTTNRMDEWCEKSTEMKRNICEGGKDDCA